MTGTRLGRRIRVPEAWPGLGHSNCMGNYCHHLNGVKYDYEAFCIGLPRCRDN